MAKDGYIDIAIGIVKTHEDRKQRVRVLNDTIDSFADAMRSPSNMDAMPHKTGYSNPVEERIEKIEAAEVKRNALQEYVDAVEYAMQNIREAYNPPMDEFMVECVLSYIYGPREDAIHRFESGCDLPLQALISARRQLLNIVLKYLNLK